MIELLSQCLTSSYIVLTPLKIYEKSFKVYFHLTKFEEGPEHPLDTGGELLSV